MPFRLHANLRSRAAVATLSGALACALPATAAAGGGPVGPSGGAGLTGAAGAGSPEVTPVAGSVSAEGNGISLTTTAAGTIRENLTFAGTVSGPSGATEVDVERAGARGWRIVARAPLSAGGAFSAMWRASTGGRILFRAELVLPSTARAAHSELASVGPQASPPVPVIIYTNAVATVYGPGFYGNRTACGIKLRPDTLGVASPTLKCGTKVSIAYGGQSIVVAVIDRGPYANGATWDLTEATAAALSDPDTEIIGAAVL